MIARAIALAMVSVLAMSSADAATVRLHCTFEGKPFADLRKMNDGHYHLRMAGEHKWSKLHDNAVGMGLVMLTAAGVKCERR
jgi:hypothetical protein